MERIIFHSNRNGKNNFDKIYPNFSNKVKFNEVKQICKNGILTHDNIIIILDKIYIKDTNIRKICIVDNDILILYESNKLVLTININKMSYEILISDEIINIIKCNSNFIIISKNNLFILTSHVMKITFDGIFELAELNKISYFWPYKLYKFKNKSNKNIISVYKNCYKLLCIIFEDEILTLQISDTKYSYRLFNIPFCGKNIKNIITSDILILLYNGSICIRFQIIPYWNLIHIIYHIKMFIIFGIKNIIII